MSRPSARVPYLQVIRGPRYFPVWLGQIVSNLGDTLNYVALVVLVFRLSHAGVAASALVLCELIPTLVPGPLAGVLIDRFDRQRLLIGADLLRALLILALAFTHVLWLVYYLLAALLAAASRCSTPRCRRCCPTCWTRRSGWPPTRWPGQADAWCRSSGPPWPPG